MLFKASSSGLEISKKLGDVGGVVVLVFDLGDLNLTFDFFVNF